MKALFLLLLLSSSAAFATADLPPCGYVDNAPPVECVNTVPEPSTLALLAIAAIGVLAFGRRKK